MKKFTNKSSVVIRGLLDYLSETGEMQLLPEVTRSLDEMALKLRHPEEILVKSAVPLTVQQTEKLKKILGKLFHLNVPLRNEIDKQLLGGFTLRINDWILDTSLFHELAAVRSALLNSE